MSGIRKLCIFMRSVLVVLGLFIVDCCVVTAWPWPPKPAKSKPILSQVRPSSKQLFTDLEDEKGKLGLSTPRASIGGVEVGPSGGALRKNLSKILPLEHPIRHVDEPVSDLGASRRQLTSVDAVLAFPSARSHTGEPESKAPKSDSPKGIIHSDQLLSKTLGAASSSKRRSFLQRVKEGARSVKEGVKDYIAWRKREEEYSKLSRNATIDRYMNEANIVLGHEREAINHAAQRKTEMEAAQASLRQAMREAIGGESVDFQSTDAENRSQLEDKIQKAEDEIKNSLNYIKLKKAYLTAACDYKQAEYDRMIAHEGVLHHAMKEDLAPYSKKADFVHFRAANLPKEKLNTMDERYKKAAKRNEDKDLQALSKVNNEIALNREELVGYKRDLQRVSKWEQVENEKKQALQEIKSFAPIDGSKSLDDYSNAVSAYNEAKDKAVSFRALNSDLFSE